MRGLDEYERRVFEIIDTPGRKLGISSKDVDAAARLQVRRLIAWGRRCVCGQHDLLVVTALGREVQQLDRLLRGMPQRAEDAL